MRYCTMAFHYQVKTGTQVRCLKPHSSTADCGPQPPVSPRSSPAPGSLKGVQLCFPPELDTPKDLLTWLLNLRRPAPDLLWRTPGGQVGPLPPQLQFPRPEVQCPQRRHLPTAPERPGTWAGIQRVLLTAEKGRHKSKPARLQASTGEVDELWALQTSDDLEVGRPISRVVFKWEDPMGRWVLPHESSKCRLSHLHIFSSCPLMCP